MSTDIDDEWKIRGLEVTPPLDSDLYLELEPLVYDVASLEWKNSHVFSIDDVAQAVWLHMMENWSEYENADRNLIFYMARRAARGYCEKQRVEHMYATGAFLYTPGMIRRYLEETVFCAPENAIDLEARVDITEAYGRLPKGQKAAIFKKFALKEPLTSPAEKSAESRGVTAMTQRLNTGLRLRPETL